MKRICIMLVALISVLTAGYAYCAEYGFGFIADEYTLRAGQSISIYDMVSVGYEDEISNIAVFSSDSKVLKADGEAIIAVSEGSAVLTAAVNYEGGTSDYDTCTVYVLKSSPADLNNDGYVNSTDLSMLLSAYGEYNLSCDTDGNGVVNSTDLSFLLSEYGKKF